MDHRLKARIFLVLSILASLGGIAGFILLFRREFNVYWLIVAPVILAIYQLPAAWLFKQYKKASGRSGGGEEEKEEKGEDAPSDKA